MSEQFEQLWQRFRGFPRAIQWALIAGVGILLFVVWNDYIKVIGDEWALEAERIERRARQVREAAALEDRFQSMDDAIVSLGPVDVPGDEKQAADALNRIVNELIDEYRNDISKENFQRLAGDRLRKGSLAGIIGAGDVGRKLAGELEFVSSPETAIAILSKLESSPEVESVTEVRVTKTGNRKVNVKFKIESWVVGRDTGRRS